MLQKGNSHLHFYLLRDRLKTFKNIFLHKRYLGDSEAIYLEESLYVYQNFQKAPFKSSPNATFSGERETSVGNLWMYRSEHTGSGELFTPDQLPFMAELH